jgi:RNA polymerase sigma-70 factor, ECF subfamily
MRNMENIIERRNQLSKLLVAAGRGNEQAFEALHAATHAYLYHVALRVLGTPALAEEVLQDAYLSVWLQAKRYQPELGSAMTWLITVVRNQAISALRGQRIEQHTVSLSAGTKNLENMLTTEDEESDPIRQSFYASARMRLPRALEGLEPAQRQAIALTFGQGLAHAELSIHMDAPLGTVKSWLRRGMARLNENIAPERARPREPRMEKRMRIKDVTQRC